MFASELSAGGDFSGGGRSYNGAPVVSVSVWLYVWTCEWARGEDLVTGWCDSIFLSWSPAAVRRHSVGAGDKTWTMRPASVQGHGRSVDFH